MRRRASVTESLLGGESDVAGEVERSVLSHGVVVEAEAVVREWVLLPRSSSAPAPASSGRSWTPASPSAGTA